MTPAPLARLLAAFTLVATLGLSAHAQAAPLLFGADGSGGNPSTLFIIDGATGAVVSTVGPIGFAVTGLAFDPTTGALYGTTAGASADETLLLTIDVATGAGTVVGSFGVGPGPMADIAFDPAGNLYGWREPLADDLYRIDKTTGAATLVGDSGLITAQSGLAIDAAGNVYFGGGVGEPQVYGLARIDPATGASIEFIPYSIQIPVGLGLTFDAAGVLYGIHRVGLSQTERELVIIDPATGALTIVGPTVDRLDALAFQPAQVPEPAMLVLSLAGAAACLARYRRRRGN